MLYIESKSNEKVKELSFLKERSARQEQHRFFFEGIHLFEEYIRFGNKPHILCVTKQAYEKYKSIISPYENQTLVLSDAAFSKLTTEMAPQGIITVSGFLPNIKENSFPEGGCVILESVRDPGNLGGIIRTAASLGIKTVVISRDCVDIYSPKTVRAAMGALFAVDVVISDDIKDIIEKLKSENKRVYAACLYGKTETLGSFAIEKTDSFVFGNEGNGVSEEIASSCTSRVIIPMSGKTESLNVAAASTVIMWEMVRNG